MVEGKRPLFFKVFLPDLSSERLRIPVGFLKHMEGKTSGSVSLTGPSGNTWDIDLIQDSDGLFFQDGWPVFVRDHFVQIGDFFVFRYDGNLHFTVCIFDRSACEKETAFHVKCSQDTKHKESKRGKKKAGKLLNASSYKPFKGVAKRMRGDSHLVHSGCITRSRAAKGQTFDKGFDQEDVFTTRRNQGSAFFNGKRKCGRPSKNSVSSSLPLSKACKDEPGIEHKDEYFPRKHQESALFNAKKKRGRPSKNSVSFSLPSLSKACKDEPGIEHKGEYLTRKHPEFAFFNRRNKCRKPSKNSVSSAILSRSKACKVVPGFETGDTFLTRKHWGAVFNERTKLGRQSKSFVSSGLLSQSKACKDETGQSPFEAATSCAPHSPHFITTIYESNMFPRKPYLNIPIEFARSNDLIQNSSITLRCPLQKLWAVKLQSRKNKSYHQVYITNGWHEFVVANQLKQRDVCIFELDCTRRTSSVIMDVHIYPA